MGEFESDSNDIISYDDYSRTAKLAVIVSILLGLFSPLLLTVSRYPGNYYLSIQSLLWSFSQSNWGGGFYFFPPIFLFSMFPIVILRLVPAAQMYRYYQGKTTRKRAFLGSIVGDIYFLVGSLIIFIVSLFSPYSSLSIPFPLQTLASLFFLFLRPVREPVTPWDIPEEARPWWEQKEGPHSEKKETKDDKDVLW